MLPDDRELFKLVSKRQFRIRPQTKKKRLQMEMSLSGEVLFDDTDSSRESSDGEVTQAGRLQFLHSGISKLKRPLDHEQEITAEIPELAKKKKNVKEQQWWLEEDDKGKLFICVNGGRLVSPATAREFQELIWIGHGRGKDEIWMKFAGEANGVRRQRGTFDTTRNAFTRSVNKKSNKTMICSIVMNGKLMQTNSELSKKSQGSKSNSPNTSIKIDIPAPLQEQYTLPTLIDTFKIPLHKIKHAPEEYLARETGNQVIECVGQIAFISIMLPTSYKGEHRQAPAYYAIGGNEVLEAMRDKDENTMIECQLFKCETIKEALIVGNTYIRNICSLYNPMTFQDMVRQAQRCLKNNIERKDILEILSNLGGKVKNSLSTIMSTASMAASDFEMVEELFTKHEETSSNSINQNLFRTIQGFNDISKTRALKTATKHGLNQGTAMILKLKNKQLLKTEFLKISGHSTFELMLQDIDYNEEDLNRFVDAKVQYKVPSEFYKHVHDILKTKDNQPIVNQHQDQQQVPDLDVHVDNSDTDTDTSPTSIVIKMEISNNGKDITSDARVKKIIDSHTLVIRELVKKINF
ncbi:unnamed protein product [Owenia fusiformis]|uniref:Uncharacterized protein n=1 Tax=Owenia fusiformis TaxID=6347 RepID=A0A8J1UR47_OWEFU|nr:unnamed protein product [Owenia fusiformis]